jgi:hypothetical protein
MRSDRSHLRRHSARLVEAARQRPEDATLEELTAYERSLTELHERLHGYLLFDVFYRAIPDAAHRDAAGRGKRLQRGICAARRRCRRHAAAASTASMVPVPRWLLTSWRRVETARAAVFNLLERAHASHERTLRLIHESRRLIAE